MAIRIENQYEGNLPKGSVETVEDAFNSLPREHTRGIERIRLVPYISDPRIKGSFRATELPGLYHPRQGPKGPWLEVAINVLLPADKPFHKRIVPRLSFKSNLVALVISLVGQHYHLTLRHSLKKTQLEPAIRSYTEKQLKLWNERKEKIARLKVRLELTHFVDLVGYGSQDQCYVRVRNIRSAEFDFQVEILIG